MANNKLTSFKQSDFWELKQSKCRRFRTDYFLFVYKTVDQEDSKFGLTVSKKVGKAVIRNRIKRLLRESFNSLEPGSAPFNFRVNVIPLNSAKAKFPKLGLSDVLSDVLHFKKNIKKT